MADPTSTGPKGFGIRSSMEIDLNGKPRQITGGTTVSALIRELGLADQACAVEVNKRLIRKAQHDEHELAQGDRVEIVTLVGGG